jgi:hypothetical protein
MKELLRTLQEKIEKYNIQLINDFFLFRKPQIH